VIAIAYALPRHRHLRHGGDADPRGRARRHHGEEPGPRGAELIMTLFGVAVAFVAQSADFLAAVQIIVYAGAIVVLFLFVIMFLGVGYGATRTSSRWWASAAFAAAGVVITVGGLIALMARRTGSPGRRRCRPRERRSPADQGNVKQLGTAIFTTYLFAFEVTAALLIIAVVGAVMLARREQADDTEASKEVEA
jgi:NADH-quinone oxidoreductase subunit J